MKSDSTVRVAVIGLGKMGLLHASLLSAMPEVKLCAVCDKSKLILRISRKIFRDVQVVDDLQKLAGSNIDAVYVTTPSARTPNNKYPDGATRSPNTIMIG